MAVVWLNFWVFFIIINACQSRRTYVHRCFCLVRFGICTLKWLHTTSTPYTPTSCTCYANAPTICCRCIETKNKSYSAGYRRHDGAFAGKRVGTLQSKCCALYQTKYFLSFMAENVIVVGQLEILIPIEIQHGHMVNLNTCVVAALH